MLLRAGAVVCLLHVRLLKYHAQVVPGASAGGKARVLVLLIDIEINDYSDSDDRLVIVILRTKSTFFLNCK